MQFKQHKMLNYITKLSHWLNVSVNNSIPSAILILSRPFAVASRLKSEEIFLATLCSLPHEVVNSLGTSLPFKDCVKQRRRELRHSEMQDALIRRNRHKKKSYPKSRNLMLLKTMCLKKK